MNTPIGHQTAGIVPIPPEIKMEAIGVEWSHGSWTQPQVVINTRGCWAIRLGGHRAHPALVGPCLHRSYFSKFSCLDKIKRIHKMRNTALPLTYLNCFAVSF